MARAAVTVCCVLGGLAVATAVLAAEGRPLRLVGEAPSARDQAPKRFATGRRLGRDHR